MDCKTQNVYFLAFYWKDCQLLLYFVQQKIWNSQILDLTLKTYEMFFKNIRVIYIYCGKKLKK